MSEPKTGRRRVILLILCGLALMGSTYFRFVVATYEPFDKRAYLAPQVANFVRPGLDLDVEAIDVGPDGTVRITFTIADDRGLPLDIDGVATPGPVRARFVLGTIPNDGIQYVSYTNRVQTSPITGESAIQPSNDSGGSIEEVHIGKYVYTFGTRLPAMADPTATHSVGIYSDRDLSEFDIPRQIDNDVVHFRPDGGEVTRFRDVVRTATCNQCHDPLALHGGFRRDIELCVMCHTSGVVDPDTGNSVNMPLMVHKIHHGIDLENGYTIIGFRQSVHDYSEVVFPHDIRSCVTCHDGSATQGLSYLLRPSRINCGSCHDHVDWESGEDHAGGPQADDSRCVVCHRPEGDEFDASVRGAHTIPSESEQLEGINLEFLDVVDSGPGQTPTAHFTLADDAGDTILPSELDRFRLSLAGPTTDYSYLRQEDASGSVPMGGSEFAYTFSSPLPADARGTFAISVEARRNVILNPGDPFKEMSHREQIDPEVFYFAVTDAEPAPRRQIVADARCEECHRDLNFHGANRRNAEYCVFCHAPEASDVRRRPAEELPAESIDFKFLIHRLHKGEELSRAFTVYGFGNRAVNFNELLFPGDLRNCAKCHVGDSYNLPSGGVLPTIAEREFFSPIPPESTACLSCHETIQAAAHAFVNIAPFAESCSVCHGEGAAFSVAKMHAR